MISGKCNDIGTVVMQQFRGMSARAPYFSNGSAANFRELVDFYDRRFNIQYSEQEKQDLVNFLSNPVTRMLPAAAVALATLAASGNTPPPTHRNFVSCPIVQDTKTVPCWMSDYEGERYYLGIQTDVTAEFHPPYLGHKVFVEGTVSAEPRICGGIVLKPVKVSPLPELDGTCNAILPAVDQVLGAVCAASPRSERRPPGV